MPATDETWYHQPTMHLIFALMSIGMLIVTVWMVLADHLRPWKEVQREFQKIERAKLEATHADRLKEQKAEYAGKIADLDKKIAAAEAGADERTAQISKLNKDIDRLGGRADLLDMQRRFKKADLDSKRSFYDGMVERDEREKAREYLNSVVLKTKEELDQFSIDLEKARADLKKVQDNKAELLGFVDKLKDDRKKMTREADNVQRALDQKGELHGGAGPWSNLTAFLRGMPGLDLMPPTKIQQISLPELTINYNFKEVPRYDRCTTCHQGIDRLGYDTAPDGHPMKAVFASHPFLSSGATTIDPKGREVVAGLYLDGNGPHPINGFGCTICHGGQGSGTDFTFASHTPDTLKQGEEWHKEHDWHSFHMWDYPMLPKRFIESSCLKCHHEVTDVPQAKKLQAGYQRIVKYGCTGCHTIGGDDTFGPDLTKEPQVGPNLEHVASKVSKDWVLKWIIDPHAFRPDTRMPRFYGLSNNASENDWSKNHAEANAIAHYLFARSTEPEGFVAPPAKTDPARGKELFLQKGCLACHQHRPYQEADVQRLDRDQINPAYFAKKDGKNVPALADDQTYAPSNFPQPVRDKALANFGPNLSNIAAKFQSKPQGLKWLTNWIHAPEKYHSKTLMPNLQLSLQDAGDIASWVLSVPGQWPVSVEVPSAEDPKVSEAVDELVKLYVSKSGSFKKPDGTVVSKSLSEVDEYVSKDLAMSDKLFYLGERTISRLGCFGCHQIPGFEDAKPIGTGLSDWGLKSPARLDYGHIREYLEAQGTDEEGARDGTPPIYQEEVTHETRMGFLFQKLHRPRSYDYLKKNEKYKPWDDRLRMPRFAWADDPKAVEEVMTFVLGLTGERVNAQYLPKTHYRPAQTAMARGAKVLNRHNCAGCHVLEMPRFTIPKGTLASQALTNLRANLRASYSGRANDYLAELYPNLKYDPNKKLDNDAIEKELGLTADDGSEITIEGMPTGLFENELTVQLWQPVTIRGYTFNVGDNIALDQTKIRKTEGTGGGFPFLYAGLEADKTGTPFESYWNRLPPPLTREGNKVQTPWLTAFLKDPYAIRPAAQLRMPRFHYGRTEADAAHETEALANYFAARDRAEFPYPEIVERTPLYLEAREKAHPGYLTAGWTMMTGNGSPCLQCHAVGPFKPTGGAEVVNGPDLRQVATRFRPEFLEAWVANPRRLVPYTAMPQNVAPHGTIQIPVPKSFADRPLEVVQAIRDTLLNYVDAVELQLARGDAAAKQPPGGTKPQAAPASAPAAAPSGAPAAAPTTKTSSTTP